MSDSVYRPVPSTSHSGPEESEAPEAPLHDERLSAFIDGELSSAEEAQVFARSLGRSPEQQSKALSYWLISDVLSSAHSPDHRPALSDRIAQKLSQEPVFLPKASSGKPAAQGRRPMTTGLRVAASVAGIFFVAAGAYLIQALPVDDQSSAAMMASGGGVPGQIASGVMRASFDSPQARVLLDAHGSTHVRMRMEDR